jgi:hypothetical protein
VIIASNVLSTNGNVIAGNVISQDGTFTGNLYVAGQIVGTITYASLNVSGTVNASTFSGQTFQGGNFIGNGSGLSGLNASNLAFGVVNSTLIYGNTLSNIQFSNIVGLLPNTISNLNASNLAFGVVDSALIYGNTLSNIQASNISGLVTVTGNTLSNLNASNLAFGVVDSALIYGNTLSNIQASNISGLVTITGNTLSNLNASNLAFGVVDSALIYGNTLSNIQASNISGLVTITGNTLSNLNASNLAFGIVNSALIYGNTLSNIQASDIVQPFGNLVVSNSVTVSNLIVTSNILPGSVGNTYITGNVVVSGNVFSALGSPLGSGGGYYLSLPTNIAVQPGYNGPVYGAAYPFSIGLSNGFTINGTSTLITITTNGNFKFNTAGPYILNAVFNSSDNITGLAVGSNVADIHGQDQGYLYRYTTFVSQNPTEVIKIPINVSDTSLYYYLDIFKVDQGTIYASSTGTGGTYLTIAPLTGGGLATGGPGGTPGTQWISAGSNIYFPNSVGVGTVNPAYNLDVSTGNTATQRLITSNISSLGLYGPLLNITSNVLIQSNLAVGGGVVPNESPPYALYVTGQGYFSNHVSYQNFAGYRNRLVNGTFRVAARANSIIVSNTSSFSVSNTWICDRWRVDVGNLSTSNVSLSVKQDVPIGTTNGFTQCANVYVIRALTGTTGNTWVCPLSQTIEASFIFDFSYGQPTAKPAVFSFYANASISGNFSVVFRSRQDNTYFANLVSITAGIWASHAIYLPPCYIGSWAAGSSNGYVDVLISGVSYGTNGSNNRAVAVTSDWTANPGFAPVSCIGATTWPATAGNILQITGPQLEEGTIPTPFEVRPLTQTYIYCQRFYETNKQTQYAAALGTGHVNSIPYVTTKRSNANVSVYRDASNLVANTNINQFTAYYGDGALKGTQAVNSYLSSQYGFSFNFTNTGSKFMDGSIMEAQFVWQADAEIY